MDGDPRHALGLEGERLAEAFLRRRGLRTVARRYNTPLGELDLVMQHGDTVVFVEVKTRSDRVHADPEDAVTRRKRGRVRRAAKSFLKEKRWEERACRFDVVTVIYAEGREPEIDYIEDFAALD